MKAVIMAGGEGTRLRPLTSNAPKPMLPLANRPMMEHIVDLLRRHGFDEIVVTVAFLANAIRTYFGDGSEFGVHDRLRHRGDAARHRRLGRATPRSMLDERFLVISGDVLTDIDLGAIVAFHDEHEALATIGLVHVENPLEFGIVITREDGTIERFLEKPTWGQVFSDTINTGIYVLEPEIFDYIARRPLGRLLAARCSPRCSPPASRSTAPSPRATGRTSARSRPTCGPTRTSSTSRSQRRHPRLRLTDGVWLGEGAEVHPDAQVVGPAVIGAGLQGRGRLPARRVHRARLQRARARPTPQLERTVRARQRLPRRRARGCAARSSAGPATSAPTCAARRAWCSATSASSARTPCSAPTSRCTRSRRSRPAPSSTPRSSGSRRGARSLFGRDGVAGLANVDITPELAAKVAMAYGTIAAEGHHGHHLARLEPVGPHAEAGDDGRAQRRRRQRARPRGGLACRSPASSCARHGRSAASRSGCTTATPSR